jgi:hypothetical protein
LFGQFAASDDSAGGGIAAERELTSANRDERSEDDRAQYV